ncbi:MAG: glycoside hydrolase family 2 TIM barrel-domain containing protein [Pirellulaceae bacterium]
MVRDDWTNLNGLWQYAITSKEASTPDDWDGEILVPYPVESALSGVKGRVEPDQRLWYRREIEIPSTDEARRWLLHFGAVDWKTTVRVNGQEVGQHVGGYDPFTIDITDEVNPGTNEVLLSVWDPTNEGYQPRGKQVLKPDGIWYTAVTGIWQTVWLEQVPRQYIESIKVVPDVDDGTVSVTVDAPAGLEVAAVALDDGEKHATATGTTQEAITLSLTNPKLWSPDTPHLYDLNITLLQGHTVLDSVSSYFGMRKIEVRRDDEGINRLFLNNEVLFQYGPLDQGWWPDGLYTPATDEAMKYDIVMTKKYGMNMARKHVKYEPARWYYWCDRLGLLVWQDMPSGNAGQSAESKANFRRELRAMLDALRHFPSVVMWIPFNEGWGQHDTGEIVKLIQDYDPTRPVNEASGWTDKGHGSISDGHSYPGPAMRDVEEDRAVVLGEFGGLGLPVADHTWQAEENWGYRSFETREALSDAYVELLGRVRPLIGRGLAAAVYTQTSDVEIEVNGLMTYDRAVAKVNVARGAAAAEKLYLPPPLVKTLVPTSETEARQWQYTTQKPGDDWNETDFDDANWKSGPGGFGTDGTPGSTVRTEWNSSDIWIRREFQLDAIPTEGQVSLTIHHDEDAEVFINGQLVKSLEGHTTSYVNLPLGSDDIQALKTGSNMMAIHCHQLRGGQYIDAGLLCTHRGKRG